MSNPDLQASDIPIQSTLDRLHEHRMDLLKGLCVAVVQKHGVEVLTPKTLQVIKMIVNDAIPLAVDKG